MTTPHPQADLLRAIADGRQMQGRLPEDGCDWFDIYPDQAIGAVASNYSMKVRIKPAPIRADALSVVAAFLLGEGPLQGVWYGEWPEGERGKYWWRKHLRAAIDAARTQAQKDSND